MGSKEDHWPRTLCDPIDGSPPGSPIPEILQARTLEWVSISFSRGLFQPGNLTWVSRIVGRFFTSQHHLFSLASPFPLPPCPLRCLSTGPSLSACQVDGCLIGLSTGLEDLGFALCPEEKASMWIIGAVSLTPEK